MGYLGNWFCERIVSIMSGWRIHLYQLFGSTKCRNIPVIFTVFLFAFDITHVLHHTTRISLLQKNNHWRKCCHRILLRSSAVHLLQWQHFPPAPPSPTPGDSSLCSFLNRRGDDVGVLLDLAGDAHVDVLITNGNDHSSDQRRVDLGRQLDALVGLQEGLKKNEKWK